MGFTNRQSLNGVSYKVYVPDNYNSNTEVLVYCHGGGDYNADYATQYLNQYGGDTVIIFPTGDEGFRETSNYGAAVVDVVNSVKQELNITNTGLSVAGYSMGSTPAYTTMGEYLKQNPNCSSSTLYLLDNYPNANFSGVNKFDSLLNEYGSLYKSNNTMFVAMIPQWGESGNYIIGSKQKELDYLVQHGITNISVLHSNKASYPGNYNDNLSGEAHHCLEKVFWVDGIFNMNNDKSLSLVADQYYLTIFNKSTGEYETVNFENLNSLDKLRQYFGINISGVSTNVSTLNNGSNFLDSEISKLASLKLYETSNSTVKSDKDKLIDNVNKVITDIKGTSFVCNGLNLNFGGSSTTKVPSGLPNIMGLYFTFVTNMLTELSSFMDNVATAGESIYNMDTELSNQATTLNNDTASSTVGLSDTPLLNNNGTNSNYLNTTALNTSTNSSTNYPSGSGSSNSSSYPTSSVSSPSCSTNSISSNNNYSRPVNNNIGSTVQDTKNEVNTAVGNNISNSGITHYNGNSSFDVPNYSEGNVTATVNEDTIEEVTTVVRDDVSLPSDNNTSLPVVDVPKHDLNDLPQVEVETPVIDNVVPNNNSNNNISNVPIVDNNTVVTDNSNNLLSTLGVTVGLGAALGGTAMLAKKMMDNKTTEVDSEDNLSTRDKKDISQYKDDFYEEA